VKNRRMIVTYSLAILSLMAMFPSIQTHGLAAGQEAVLAKVGNDVITEIDLKEMVSAFPDKTYQTPEGQKKALDYLVNIYVLAAEAQAQGMDKDPEVQRFLNFNRNDLLARVYLDKMSKNLPAPTDEQSKEYYEKNKDQFVIPESVLLHHILVKTEPEAKDVAARLKKGEKFADVASQVSICPSKVKGGNLDWLPKGSLVKEIEDVAFTMNKGQTSGPVQSKFGWHILFLEDKKPPQETGFDQVQGQIIERLKFQSQQDQFEKLSQELRKKMNVQITAPKEEPVTPAGPAAAPKN
jgi:peptidyl-prolyl cis-trans isomerase C